jgi:hypothetical protein
MWQYYIKLPQFCNFNNCITDINKPVTGTVVAQRGVEVQLYSSKTSALEGGEWSAARPGRILPPGKTGYPLYRRLGEPQGRSGRARNLDPHRDSIPGRVQPVVSRYTDWATRPTYYRYQSNVNHNRVVHFMKCNIAIRAPGKLVYIAIRYRLTARGSKPGGGEIFCTRPDRPWGPPSLLYNGYRITPGG